MKKENLNRVWNKTAGHCHICGIKLKFNAYGKNKFIVGNWNKDHVRPKAKGGVSLERNYLPICGICNGLRWNRTGKDFRELLYYGVIFQKEAKKGTVLGRKLKDIFRSRVKRNVKRRGTGGGEFKFKRKSRKTS